MRKFIYIGLILVATLTVYIYSEYNKVPETAEDKKSDYALSVTEFVHEFITDATVADSKYKNKTVELTGVVKEINLNGDNTDVLLETNDDMINVNIQLTPTNKTQDFSLKVGNEATFKALYVGVLTDFGIDIELNQATVLNK